MSNESDKQKVGAEALGALRAQIDALDDSLLNLIEKRLDASRAVAALKSEENEDHLWLRPRREAAILERLSGQARIAPPTLIAQVWRELMAFSLQAQMRTEIHVHGSDPERLTRLVRARFGSAAPLVFAPSAADAIAAAAGGHVVAVVEDSGDAPLPPGLAIFDRVRDEKGEIAAAAIGRIATDALMESGDGAAR